MDVICGRCGHPGPHATDEAIPGRCVDCAACQQELDDEIAAHERERLADPDFVAHALEMLRHLK
jgi:hypothetical protein